jgi:UDP-N-acetylglucosamine--N-acetylmuramyl-(pentapeptide) pyrophosphoryl-undecaprenol N-acetylglucosamine transferase
MSTRVLIMAGGTGGHVFPALAVARELAARGCDIRWLGTRKGMEVELVGRAGFPMEFISVAGLRGNGLAGWLAAPFRLTRAVWQARGVMRRYRPHVVIGFGGFVTGPGGVAAKLGGVPLVIHEQNAIAGLTNKLLARVAGRVLQAFPRTFPRAETTGNPVRAEIAAVTEPVQRFAEHTGPIRLLVVGGSLGAAALNQTVPAALAELDPAIRPVVHHQTGQRNLEAARQHYREAGVEAELLPFVDDMAAAYAWADLVLCRAGALTVSELAAAGAPAVLVPFPYAVDDHQTHNARFLVDAGAATLVPQQQLTAAHLAELVRDVSMDPTEGRRRLTAMARAARARALPAAARQVADISLALATKEQA